MEDDQSNLQELDAEKAENESLKKEKDSLMKKLRKIFLENNQETAVDENLTTCPVCSYTYNKMDRVPVIGTCGHTVCRRCAHLLPGRNCPICRSFDSFRQPSKNFFACDYIEKSLNLEEEEEEEVEVEVPKTPERDPNVQGNTILIMGGTSEYQKPGRQMILDIYQWTGLNLRPPYKPAGSGVVCLNEEIYLIGGAWNPRALYKLDNDLEWIQLADMNIGRDEITNSCVVWNGCIWVLGGMKVDTFKVGEPLTSVERYDPTENTWTEMPPMKYPRLWAAAAVWNEGIVISGGIDDNRDKMNTVEFYQNDCWTELPHLPAALHSHALVSYQNQLITIGGLDGRNNLCDKVWKYDAVNSKWDEEMSLGFPSGSLAGIVLDDNIYAIGGCRGDSNTARVEIFNGENWQNRPDLPYRLLNISAVVIPQHLANRLWNLMPIQINQFAI